jgi:hypothetical protein
MSQVLKEGRLSFSFPDTWLLCRPQETSYYRRHFQKFCDGCKEMDFLAFDPTDNILWLIEVKDYRVNHRIKQGSLADEVACKTRDVLAMLPTGGIRDLAPSTSGSVQVRDFWQHAKDATNIRVVLHCELPSSPSKLFPGIKDAANLQTKLSQKLHCVDPRVIFTNLSQPHRLSWDVHSK